MKLLLTSSGATSQAVRDKLKEILSVVSNPKIMIVADIIGKDDYFYTEAVSRELEECGFSDHFVFDINKDIIKGDLSHIDMFYICGGNTFHILHRLRVTGLADIIIDSVKMGEALYFGVSAGSIIAGPDIESAGYGKEGDKNNIKLEDLTGFHLTSTIIFPHFREELEDDLSEIRKSTIYSVREIADGEAIYIDEDGEEFVG